MAKTLCDVFMSELKPKRQPRRKPFPATLASRKALEASGWTVGVVETRIPHTFITRDLFGFADLLACSPTRGILLVQVTGSNRNGDRSNFLSRVRKVKASAEAALWLASGGRIQVHSWEAGPTGDPKDYEFPVGMPAFRGRYCRVLEITKETIGENQ